MSSTDAELIPSVLSMTVSSISRTTSAPSVLTTSNPARDTLHDDQENNPSEDVQAASSLDAVDPEGIEAWSKVDGLCTDVLQDAPMVRKPFHKWMKTLQRRAGHRHVMMLHQEAPFPANGHHFPLAKAPHHRHSSSGSSTAFVTTMKSASVSVAGTSLFAKSRRNTARSSRARSRADRSSAPSIAHPRLSTDSTCAERPVIVDQAITERSLQRRRILEELIETEESYIGDVRFLMNVYITILASLPSLAPGFRSSINQNLTEIIQLHEELLGDLHRAVPHSEYSQFNNVPAEAAKPERTCRTHRRWKSLDAVLEDKASYTLLQSIPGMTTEPQVAAEVAKVFSKKMNRFFIYEEYGAKYELMIKDVASAHRTMPKWESYQKGLETLAAALGTEYYAGDLKKSLTIGDLLVKPIQRVCRYPLLFAELLKYTPVCDCPHSHMEIEAALVRLREATAEINRATDDLRVKESLAKTWILQDRLVFPNQSIDAACKNQIRGLGHIQLCGALHVCWQTKGGVDGQYMVSLLYREWLCLASASRADQIYTIQACINVTTAKVEDVDNGRGIQCHTAPYSWKLVFLCDHQLYEVIMTACNPREEQEWRTRLAHASGRDAQMPHQPIFDSLALDIKALGTVFGKQGTIARRVSVHRATTVGPKTPLCQVILRNTSVDRDPRASSSSSSSSSISSSGCSATAPINRSMSLLTGTTTPRIPVLAPPRGERARLEALLSDVWTRDFLPFPGMTLARGRRSEYLAKASATSMMRRLSVASIAGSFGRRSHGGGDGAGGWRSSTTDGHAPGDLDAASPSAGFGVVGRRKVRSEPAVAGRRGTDSSQPSMLSSIPDDEGTAESYPKIESEWGVDVLRAAGLIVGADATKRQTEDTTDQGVATTTAAGGPEGPGRRKRVRVGRTFSTLKKGRAEVRLSEKENLECIGARKNGRWKPEGVVRGLRSLFL